MSKISTECLGEFFGEFSSVVVPGGSTWSCVQSNCTSDNNVQSTGIKSPPQTSEKFSDVNK